VVSVAGGNPYAVDGVSDGLGNTWKKAISGVNGDNTDVEIWYTNSMASGLEQVGATLKALPGTTSAFVQSYVTVAEFNGAGAFHAGHAAHSSRNGSHASGAFSSTPGDLVVGGYADAGYIGNLTIIDNKSKLGTIIAGRDAIQGIQSYGVAGGASSSVGYANNHFARAEVAGASFTPISASPSATTAP